MIHEEVIVNACSAIGYLATNDTNCQGLIDVCPLMPTVLSVYQTYSYLTLMTWLAVAMLSNLK